jgi:tetratricopeptide (TPR) repeat protein
MTNYCKHGKVSGTCGCWSSRNTRTLLDAWLIYKSGYGSWLEWVESADILFANGYVSEGAECALRAIDSLASFPKIDPLRFRHIISQFVRSYLKDDSIKSKGKIKLGAVSQRFAWAKVRLTQLREHRTLQKQTTAPLMEAEREIDNSIHDADGGKPHERVRLAKMFRRFNMYKHEYRWDKPAVSVALMEEQLAQKPTFVAARNVLASALGDLGEWDRAEFEALKALEMVADDREQKVFLLHTLGRILNGKGNGYRAWDFLKEAMDFQPRASTAAMLNIACALAELQEDLTPEQRETLKIRRRHVSSLFDLFGAEDKESSESALVQITIQALVFEARFVEALVYVRELQREGVRLRIDFWNHEIDREINRAKKSVREVRLLAELVIKDIFPEINDDKSGS